MCTRVYTVVYTRVHNSVPACTLFPPSLLGLKWGNQGVSPPLGKWVPEHRRVG